MDSRKFAIGDWAEHEFSKREQIHKKLNEIKHMVDNMFAIVQNQYVVVEEKDVLHYVNQMELVGETWDYIDETLYEVLQAVVSKEIKKADE